MQEHVSNKSAYLCGVMKTYRQKTRAGASATSNGGTAAHQVGARSVTVWIYTMNY